MASVAAPKPTPAAATAAWTHRTLTPSSSQVGIVLGSGYPLMRGFGEVPDSIAGLLGWHPIRPRAMWSPWSSPWRPGSRLGRRREGVMNGIETGNGEASRDRWVLRLGALAGVLGIFLELAMGMLHAGHTDPNDSAKVFLEYAASDIWTAVHIGQFFGAALIGLSL